MESGETFSIAFDVKAKHGALAEALERRGWNQAQGAEFLGIHPSRFASFINMKVAPKRLSKELAEKLFIIIGRH